MRTCFATSWASCAQRHSHALFIALAAFGGACAGDIGDSSSSSDTPGGNDIASTGTGPNDVGGPGATSECHAGVVTPGPSPVRRLTIHEYNNTVRDLLNDTASPANAFPEEERGLGFTNNANSQSTSNLLVEAYEASAADLAVAATANLPKLMSCDPIAQGDSCVRTFLTAFGLKAYRRPLETAEVDRLFSFYSTNKQAYDVPTAVRMTVQAVLESPYFIYRVETQGATSVSQLSGYEIASRLSYLFWSSMPDAALFDAAASGKLSTSAGIAEQARRLFQDPRARQSIETFFSEWLGTDGKAQKDPALFPKFTPEVQGLLRQESTLFVDDLVFKGGSLQTLLFVNYTFMNRPLASYYGVQGPSGDTFEKVTLDPSKRAGVLTQAGLLAIYAKVNQTSPIARGHFVRESLLCDPPPQPPPNIPPLAPPSPSLTTRERLAQHRTNAACSGCHTLMDPLGFGFEHFDAAGLWRDTEAGKAIDATGEVTHTSDADGTFNGAMELASKLSKSTQVQSCAVKQAFRFGYGRGESDLDQCTLDRLGSAFAKNGGDFGDLLIELTQTDAFFYRSNEVAK